MFKRGLWLNMPSICLYLAAFLLPAILFPAQVQARSQARTTACAAHTVPEKHSLLIVLLDRSSSLTDTDPGEYSTSVTRMMANLWPGLMTVIFFSGTTQPLPQLGPLDLTQPGARTRLQDQIEAQRNTLSPNTPTQAAVEQARTLLEQKSYPAGSQVMLITDGQPSIPGDQDGNQQIATIEQEIGPGFCAHGVPINTFGLSTQVPDYTQTFLRQVATTSGGTYQAVNDPTQLATPVLQLYASWQNLKLVATGSSHQFLIDTYARVVDFIAFLNDSTTFPVTLLGPDKHPVPAQQLAIQAEDIHYQFDQLAIQQFNTSGTYTIQTDDTSVQTYVLEETRLQVTLLSPASGSTLEANQPVTISVALFDNNNPNQHIHPGSNESVTIGISYLLQRDGKTLVNGEKRLVQQAPPNDDIFSTQITLPSPGTLTLTISASYQYVPIPDTPKRTLQVTAAPASSCSGPLCQIQNPSLWLLVVVVLVVIALLILFFLLLRQPHPYGFLEYPQKKGQGLVLGRQRSLSKRLFHRSSISADELTGFDFQEAQFSLQFKRGHRVLLVASQNTPSLAIWCAEQPGGQQMQPVKTGSPVPLHERDRILVNGFPSATFYNSEPARKETTL